MLQLKNGNCICIALVCFSSMLTSTKIRTNGANRFQYRSLYFSILERTAATFPFAGFFLHEFYLLRWTEQSSGCRWRLDVIRINFNLITNSFLVCGPSTEFGESPCCRRLRSGIRLPEIDRQLVLSI